jgi:hypothetical protein
MIWHSIRFLKAHTQNAAKINLPTYAEMVSNKPITIICHLGPQRQPGSLRPANHFQVDLTGTPGQAYLIPNEHTN